MKTTAIDLDLFCDHDPDRARYQLNKPFVQDGVRYATDSRIAVAVTAADEPDTVPEFSKLPLMTKAHFGHDTVKKWSPLPERATDCEECRGVGRAECNRCYGSGTCECDMGHEHDCQNCDDGKMTCKCFVTFGEYDVATWLVEKMRTLPGVEWGVGAKRKDAVLFRFDGGTGTVMPLDPKRDKTR